MSEAVSEAEKHLGHCLEAMRDALQLTVEDALPQSTVGDEDHPATDDDLPDTLKQSLEWERNEEVRRVKDQAKEVQRRVELLRRAVVALGGGDATQPIAMDTPVVDVSVEALDKEIEVLSAESTRLGSVMIERYDEARALASALEAEIISARIPSL